MFLVKSGESRTPGLLTRTIPKNTSDINCSYTNSVLDSGSPEVGDLAEFESDPLNLIPRLLDQIIAIGQTAQQLRHALSGNGPPSETLSEMTKQLGAGSEHAP